MAGGGGVGSISGGAGRDGSPCRRDPGRHGRRADLAAQHPPLYTAGTSARPEELEQPDRFPTYRAGRGGQWTYHGPGQRIGYVMLDLNRAHGRVPARDVRGYVHALEEWLIRTVGRFGVRGERRNGRVGIWVADGRAGTEAKIAAIGVRVTRWVSWHGVALNVAPDLDAFRRHRPLRHPRTRRDKPRGARRRRDDGRRGRGAAGELGGGVRVESRYQLRLLKRRVIQVIW